MTYKASVTVTYDYVFEADSREEAERLAIAKTADTTVLATQAESISIISMEIVPVLRTVQ